MVGSVSTSAVRFRSTRTVVEPLYKNRDLSDIDVEVRFIQPDGSESEATVYPLHTLLLKANSQWFKETLSRSDSGRAQKVELLFDNRIDYPPAVEQVFTYFYTHEIEITQNNFKSLLQVAYILGVERLIDHCVDYIKPRLTTGNCLQALMSALEINHENYLLACFNFIAEHFSYFNVNSQQYLCELEPSIIAQILRHPRLAPECESQVLSFVQLYASGRELAPEAVNDLYTCVRMHFLNSSTLADLGDDPRVPNNLVRQAMALRLRLIDSPHLINELPVGSGPRHSYKSMNGKFNLPYDDPSIVLR